MGVAKKILGALHAPLLCHCFTSHVILATPLDLLVLFCLVNPVILFWNRQAMNCLLSMIMTIIHLEPLWIKWGGNLEKRVLEDKKERERERDCIVTKCH